MTIHKVGIVGTGQMGLGIAQWLIQQGTTVVAVKMTGGDTAGKTAAIDKALQKLVDREKLSAADKDAAMDRLTVTTDLKDLANCDLVIESIVEELPKKRDLFAELEHIVKPEGVFASNTSTLGITEIASAVGRKDKFYGLHFFNPATVMKLVEVIPTVHSDPARTKMLLDWVVAIGKTPVEVKDETGFIVNRLLTPYMVDAIRSLERGLAGVNEIDTAMKLGCNHPMGPLELADYIGLDIVLHMTSNLYNTFGESRFCPPPLLKRLVLAEQLGRKAGIGFYDYSDKVPVARRF